MDLDLKNEKENVEPQENRFEEVGGNEPSREWPESDLETKKGSSTKMSALKKKFQLLKEKIREFFQNPKKRLIFIICMGVITISAFGAGMYFLTNENGLNGEKKKSAKDDGVKYPAVLDGVMTDQESANKHPLGIIVENHPDARPQSGLDKASIVYEAIAEGGITRFLALFGTHEAEKVGPVRSARTYYVDWAHGYDAFLAHVGGNMDALEKIGRDKILDLDQFRFSAPYWRERASGLATEHTMYTSTSKLREQAKQNNYSTANNFNVFKFKEEPAETEKAALPESQTISVNFSSAQYEVGYQYDKATNSYKRLLAGTAHVDKVSKEQLNPKNVVVMTVKRKATVTKINEPGWDMTTNGTGAAKIFLDGKTIEGTWKKNSDSDNVLFYDSTGAEVQLNRGQIWICVIPPDGSVAVK